MILFFNSSTLYNYESLQIKSTNSLRPTPQETRQTFLKFVRSPKGEIDLREPLKSLQLRITGSRHFLRPVVLTLNPMVVSVGVCPMYDSPSQLPY